MRRPELAVSPIVVVLLAVTLSGCGGSSPPAAEKSPSLYDPHEKTWFSEPFDPSDLPAAGVDDAPGDTSRTGPFDDGVKVDMVSTPADQDPQGGAVMDGVTEDPEFHPCSYVDPADWASFAVGTTATADAVGSYEVEPGEECLYTADGDRARMSVAVYSRAGSTGWLDAGAAAQGEPVDGVPGGLWLAAYPTPYANTLVSSSAKYDAVIVIYARDKKPSTSDQKSAAVRWLAAALSLISQGKS